MASEDLVEHCFQSKKLVGMALELVWEDIA